MKMILKVIDAPFALVLALLTALCWFLFDLCAFFRTIASVIVAILGIDLFFTPTPLGGFVFMFLAFLLSPYGLQGGGCLADRSAGRRKIYSMPFSCKLMFFVKYFSLKKASEFPFFSKGFSLPSAGIMYPCA